MSLSGAMLVLFLIGHLVGNLEVFGGPDAINAYGVFLRTVPKLLWTLRIAVILAFVVHIYTSIQLSLENRAARPVKYEGKKSVAATLASRTMLTGGLVVLAFLLYHLAHFTFGITNPEHASLIDAKGRPDIYSMMIFGFQNTYVSVMYIVAQACLAFHLAHGFGSAAQTLGLTSCGCARVIRLGGQALAIVICALYISIPFSVMMGWLHA